MTKTPANICIYHALPSDAYSGLIDDLAQVLAQPGHKVWSVGADSHFDGGLIAQLQVADWWLVLLTAEQRRSIVHNKAVDKVLREKILSNAVMTLRLADTVHLSAPLPLATIQWADLSEFEKNYPSDRQNAEQLNHWQAWLSEQCCQILECIEKGSNTEPQLAELAQHLKPADFVTDIVSKAESFTSRNWLATKVNEWLETSEERICLLEGPIGIGKSAFSAHLAETHMSVIGAFFCHAAPSLAQTPKDFVRTLAYQLAVRLPDYRAWLSAQCRENAKFSEQSLEHMTTLQLANELIFNMPGIDNESRERKLIIIDGLDRTLLGTLPDQENAEPSLIELLAGEFNKKLPAHIRILVTSRQDRSISPLFKAKSITISQDDKHQRDDVALYLQHSLEASGVKGAELEHLLTELKSAAKGSMLYAKTLASSIYKSDVSLPLASEVRFMELELHYLKLMEEVFDEARWRTPVKGVAPHDIARELAKHSHPLSKAHLQRIFNMQKRDFNTALAPLYPFLLHGKDEDSNDTIAFIHNSFVKWLIAPQQPHVFQVS